MIATFPAYGRSLLLLSLLALVRCGGDETTRVQLVLTPDPSISSLDELVAGIERFELIVDAAGGLHGIDAPGALPGGGEAIDWDGDGKLEVRFEASSVDGALPVLELGVGANADRELLYRVFGFGAEGAAVKYTRAIGHGGASATIPSGELRRVGAPFNLTPWARPPRVLMIHPSEGATAPENIGAATAVFSTTIDEASLSEPGAVRLHDPLGAELEVTTTVEPVIAAGAFGEEERSLIWISLPALFEKGWYELQVGAGIESAAGKAFDQDPQTAAAERFVSRFWSDGLQVGGGKPCELPCPDGYECHVEHGCVPLRTCDGLCGGGLVCDPLQSQCVADCRPTGLCLGVKTTCDQKTGLCL